MLVLVSHFLPIFLKNGHFMDLYDSKLETISVLNYTEQCKGSVEIQVAI